MKLRELKERIASGRVGNSLMVFVWEDNNFLARQYVHEIARSRGQEICYVDTFGELADLASDMGAFGEEFGSGMLKVLCVDTLEELASEGMCSIEDSIIVCNRIAKEVMHSYADYPNLVVEFPKPEPWQVKDYIASRCPGLGKDSIENLYTLTGGDIFRIDNELGKISCFPENMQEGLFRDMVAGGAYSDTSQLGTFNIVNALVRKDRVTLAKAMSGLGNMDVDSVGLATLLHNSIRNIIEVQMNPKATPGSSGMSDKQFNVVRKYNCGRYSDGSLRSMLMFLDEFDFRLKGGRLDMSNEDRISYLVCRIMEEIQDGQHDK